MSICLPRRACKRYQQVKATIAAWLREKKIPHSVPPPLPSEQYGDASHPLAAGYEEIARQLAKDPFFRSSVPNAVSPVQAQ